MRDNWPAIDAANIMCNELGTPLGFALAVTLNAMQGWGDFTVDDFQDFLAPEIIRQIHISLEEDKAPQLEPLIEWVQDAIGDEEDDATGVQLLNLLKSMLPAKEDKPGSHWESLKRNMGRK